MSYELDKALLETKLAEVTATQHILQQMVGQQAARIKELEAANAKLEAANVKLEAELVKLRAQAKTDSSNSSTPPSKDGYKKKTKPVSLRGKSGRKPGGQPGHPGTTLKRSDTPDKIERHVPGVCKCGCDLHGLAGEVVASRQEHDLPPPPPRLEVTEHQVVEVVCPHCGKRNRGCFPKDIAGSVQYGPRLTANVIHVCYYELTPLERAVELFRELFRVRLSEGTVVNMLRKFSELVKDPVNRIWDLLVMSDLLHFDETGMRANKRLRWVHLASTELLTYFFIHDKRGAEAIEAVGLLPLFKGKAVHDFWKPYFSFEDVIHCLCVAHLLRELKMSHEQYAQKWAGEMIGLLVRAHELSKLAKDAALPSLPPDTIASIEAEYKAIVGRGMAENKIEPGKLAGGKRGEARSKPVNLLARFDGHLEDILRFAKDLTVPFDNNLAERDIRFSKLRDKISGTFRGEDGGADFLRVRSYISTARKNAVSAFEAIFAALTGHPFVPEPSSA